MAALFSYYIGYRVVAGYLATAVLFAASAVAQPKQDVKLWLQWLGVTAATRQVDRIIEQEVQHLSVQQVVAGSNVQAFREKLLQHSGSKAVTTGVEAYLLSHLPNAGKTITAQLENPLAERVRNFDVALEMSGAFEKYQSFIDKQLQNPVSEKRIALMQQLDQVLRTSQIAALLQTQINITAKRLAENMTHNQRATNGEALQWVQVQMGQRRRHLRDVVVRLHLFSYRFMQDKEIQQYITLMNDRAVQSLLDTIVQGLEKSLQECRENVLK